MAIKYKFVSPEFLSKVQETAARMVEEWDYPRDRAFQVVYMVGTIMIGGAKITKFHECPETGKIGIVVRGWNSESNPNPYSAWGGFYRMERGQDYGTILHFATSEGCAGWESPGHCITAGGSKMGLYDLVCEDRPMAWDYAPFVDCRTWEEALELYTTIQETAPRLKRITVEHSLVSGCYRVRWETTVKPAKEYRGSYGCPKYRIARKGPKFHTEIQAA